MLLRQNNPDLSDPEEDDNDSDEEGVEWNGIENIAKPDGVDEYVDEDKFTTVTIETMDADPKKWNGEEEDVEKVAVEEKDGDEMKKRVWTKEKPKRAPKAKKPKFRYESKAERQQTRNKQRQKNQKAAAARKGDD